MDIARLLSCDDDESAADATPSPVSSPSPSPILTASVTRAPRRRTPSLQRLRARAEAYEHVVANLPYALQSPDGDEEHPPNDEKTRRMRAFLRNMVTLVSQEQSERQVRTELLAMLKHHYESTTSLHKLMRGMELNDWYWQCERWRSLSAEYYHPFTPKEYVALVKETMRAIKCFKMPSGARENNYSFYGWRDSQAVDERFIHFVKRKTYCSPDIKTAAEETWSIYEHAERFKEFNIGRFGNFFHEIIQRISDDMMVLHTIEQYPGMDKMVRQLALVFRMQTTAGYMLVLRCTCSPELDSVMECEGIAKAENFFWCNWDVLTQDANGKCREFLTTLTGSIGADDPGYARRWVTELIFALARVDTFVVGPQVSLVESKNTPSYENNAS